jgi:hypothetical protein
MDIQYGQCKRAWQVQAPFRHREVSTFYPNYKKQIPLYGQPRTVFSLLRSRHGRVVLSLPCFTASADIWASTIFTLASTLISVLQALLLKQGYCHGRLRLESYFHNHYLAGAQRSLIY